MTPINNLENSALPAVGPQQIPGPQAFRYPNLLFTIHNDRHGNR